MNRPAAKTALCGVLAGLAAAVMTLGTVIPIGTFCCPALASMLLIPVLDLCGRGYAAAWYGAVALLSLLLAPDREAAMVFVFLGYYPIVQPCFSRIRRLWLQRAAKLIYFNCAIAVLYALLLFVIGAPALRGEFASLSAVLFAVILLLGNIAFYLCDLVLTRLTRVWHFRWRKKLLKKL